MSLGIKNWVSTPIPIENSGAVPLPVGECEAVHISYDIEKTDGVHHYERVNIITCHGEFIVGNGLVECHQCGKKTNLHEICYEAPFCSDECLAEYDKKCLAAMGGDY